MTANLLILNSSKTEFILIGLPQQLAKINTSSSITTHSARNATLVFTALHGMHTRSSDEKAVRLSVCLSVCLSVKPVDCDKTKERSVQIFILHERSYSLVFWEEKWSVRGDPLYLKFLVNRPPLERNRRFLTDIPP